MKINEKEAEDGQFEKSFKKYFAFYLKLVEFNLHLAKNHFIKLNT